MTDIKRMELITDNRDLVIKIAHEYDNGKMPICEVICAGVDGLTNAATSFNDNELSIEDFRNYAIFYIKSEINKYIQKL